MQSIDLIETQKHAYGTSKDLVTEKKGNMKKYNKTMQKND